MNTKKIVKTTSAKESLAMIQTTLMLSQILDYAKLDKDSLEIDMSEITENSKIILKMMTDEKLMNELFDGIQSGGEIKLC